MRTDEHGFVGGLEVLPFGILIFVLAVLLVANAWAVVDAKLAADSAAREATRAYVEAGDAGRAPVAAAEAARLAVRGMGRDPERLTLTDNNPPYVRCATIEHRAAYRVPALTIPIIGGLGSGLTVRGRHREVLDPLAANMGEDSVCGF